MRWVPFTKEIKDPYRIDGDPSAKARHFLSWWPCRQFTDLFCHNEALLVEVEPRIAAAGYRFGLRQETEGKDRTLATKDLLYDERFLVVIGKRPWLAFAVDREGGAVPLRITRYADKADPELTGCTLL